MKRNLGQKIEECQAIAYLRLPGRSGKKFTREEERKVKAACIRRTRIAVEAVNLDLRGTKCFKLFRVRCAIEKESRGAVDRRNKRSWLSGRSGEIVELSGTIFNNIFESLIARRSLRVSIVFVQFINHVPRRWNVTLGDQRRWNPTLRGNSITFEL